MSLLPRPKPIKDTPPRLRRPERIVEGVSANHGIESQVTATPCTTKSDCDSKKKEVCAKRDGEETGRCIETWFGLCHAWAPAATMTQEPQRSVMHNGVEFKINDIKALVTISYTEGLKVRFLSKRCNDKDDGTGKKRTKKEPEMRQDFFDNSDFQKDA